MPGQQNRNDDLMNLGNIRKTIQGNETELFLSGLNKKVRYVPLEKREDVLLARINKIYLINDFIFVSDNQSVFQFDINGRFIKQFGGIGRGPGEFIAPIRFSVDPLREEVMIFSTITNRLNVYNMLTGDFKFYRDLPFFVSNFGAFSNGNRFFFTQEFLSIIPSFSINEVYFSDTGINLVDSIGNPLRMNIMGNSVGYVSYFLLEDKVYYIYNYRDTLYQISPEFERTPFAVFNLQNELSRDNLEIFPVEGQTVFPDFLWISRIVGNSDYLFVDFMKGFTGGDTYNPIKLVFDKNTQNSFVTQGFTNDIDGGLSFWPRWVSNGALINYFHPHEMIDYYNKTRGRKTHAEAFVKLVNRLNEYDNPVLMILEKK